MAFLENKTIIEEDGKDAEQFISRLVNGGLSKRAINANMVLLSLKLQFKDDFNHLEEMHNKFTSIYDELEQEPELISYSDLLLLGENNIIRAKDIDKFLGKYYFLYYLQPNMLNDEFIENVKTAPLEPLCLFNLFEKAHIDYDKVNYGSFVRSYIRDVMINNQASWLYYKGMPTTIIVEKNYGKEYANYSENIDFISSKYKYKSLFLNRWKSLKLNNAEKYVYENLDEEEIYADAIISKNESDYFRALELFKMIPEYKDSKQNINNLNKIINSDGKNGEFENIQCGELEIFEEQKKIFTTWKKDLVYAMLMAIFGVLPIFAGIAIFTSAPSHIVPVGFVPFVFGLVFEVVAVIYFVKARKR